MLAPFLLSVHSAFCSLCPYAYCHWPGLPWPLPPWFQPPFKQSSCYLVLLHGNFADSINAPWLSSISMFPALYSTKMFRPSCGLVLCCRLIMGWGWGPISLRALCFYNALSVACLLAFWHTPKTMPGPSSSINPSWSSRPMIHSFTSRRVQ